jgi:tellurite resistance protein
VPVTLTPPTTPIDPRGRPAPARLPLNTFAIGFGLAGLAEVWSKASPALALPRAVPQAFWAVAAIAWVWLLVAHSVRGARSEQGLISHLRHPAQGPIAALAPVIAMLLAADLFTWSPAAGRTLYLLALAASAVFAAWLLSSWFEGGLDLEAVHAGYLLPTVAPGLIGAEVAQTMGYGALASGLFAVGAFFTVVMTPILVLRLTFHSPLGDASQPTTAILLAPPAVGGLAWFSLNGHTADPVAQAIAGVGVLLLLVQVAMLPRYRRLRFSLGFWAFTFPLAAAVALAEEWLELLKPAGWQAVTGALTALFTVFVAVIAVLSLRLIPRHSSAERSTR